MDLIANIKKNEQVKESLIELNALSKEKFIGKDDQELRQRLIELLDNEDPKIRKNSAILLGYYGDTVRILLDKYYEEKTDFIKDAYLKGICFQNNQNNIQELLDIQNELIHLNSESSKHIQAQLKILNPFILKNQTHKKKVVKLKHEPVDVVLTSLPYYQFVLFENVLHLKYKPVTQGVLVRTQSLYELLNLRTYKEM
ncbi:MAG: hypothetical protein RR585_15850, partial [Coprobacillus sp.]